MLMNNMNIVLKLKLSFSLICWATIFLFGIQGASAQQSLGWDVLEQATFEVKINEETQTYWLIPEFSDVVQFFDNERVSIEGYFIQMDTEENIHVLSRFPYSSCFFCGAAGPESIVELQMKDPIKSVPMDERIRVEGQFQLNSEIQEHFNYILKNVTILSDCDILIIPYS